MKYPRAFIFHNTSEELDNKRSKKLLGSKQEVYFEGQAPKDSSIEREIRLLAKYDRLKNPSRFARTCIVTDATLISDFFRMAIENLNLSIYWLDEKKIHKSILPAIKALENLQIAANQLSSVINLHHFSLHQVCDLIPDFDWNKYPEYDIEYLCSHVKKDLLPLRRSILAHLKVVTRNGIINRLDLS